MFDKSHKRITNEDGFTLIELLVVILIIGILAAIAIPAFLSQKSKANDAAAKTQAGTMQSAMETYATENDGVYTGVSVAKLQAIEPTLKEVNNSKPLKAEGTASGYTVESESVDTKDTFTLEDKAGEEKRTCKAASESNKGGCPAGTW
jgi:type IV pilus assembly protein PilA